jgi:AcrR family transcriptional regulator
MPSLTRRPASAGHRSASEAKILEATERLLADGASFTELGVQRIAAEAGIGRTTFYVHFADKTALLLRLIDQVVARAFELTEADLANGPGAMVASMVDIVHHWRKNWYLLAATLEAIGYDPAVREFWDGQLQQFIDRAEKYLREAQEAGQTSMTLSAPTAARLFIYGGMQTLTRQILNGPEDQDEVVAREIALIVWQGAFRRQD